MYLKSEKIVVMIDGVRFTSYQTALPQFVLDPIAISGWYDGVDIRRDITPRPTSSGDFAEGGRFASRVVSFNGTAIAKTARQLGDMRDQFMAILNEGGFVDMSLEDSSGVRYLGVGLEGQPIWLRQSDTVASWRISLYAPDPRIVGPIKRQNLGDGGADGGLSYPLEYPLHYNTNSDAVQAKTMSNNGNIAAWPTFIVTGNFSAGFTISDGAGKQVEYTGMVTTQAPVLIDMARGIARQSDQDKTILVRKRQWFSIPPNGAIRPEFKATRSGAGWCDILYRDTWI